MTPHELVSIFCFTGSGKKLFIAINISEIYDYDSRRTSHVEALRMIREFENCNHKNLASFAIHFLTPEKDVKWKSVRNLAHLKRLKSGKTVKKLIVQMEEFALVSHMAPSRNLDIFTLKTVLRLNEHRKVFCNPRWKLNVFAINSAFARR